MRKITPPSFQVYSAPELQGLFPEAFDRAHRAFVEAEYATGNYVHQWRDALADRIDEVLGLDLGAPGGRGYRAPAAPRFAAYPHRVDFPLSRR